MEQVTLFSALDGVVLKDGAPLRGARLVRRWHFDMDGAKGEDEAVTSDQGRFMFPAVVHQRRGSFLLAQQPVVTQVITVHADGGEWRVWAGSKTDMSPGGEAPGAPVPLQVTIDLDAPMALSGRVAGKARIAGAMQDEE